MESLEATTHVLPKRAAPYLLVALLSTLPATSALAETTYEGGDLIVKGQACVGAACVGGTFFPNDPLRIHGPEPVLSMYDSSNNWSIGITNEGGPSEFFVRDVTSDTQVLRMNVDGAVALGAGAELVKNAVSVGATKGDKRRVIHVADAVDDTDAVNMGQFKAFQADALKSVGTSAEELEQELQKINNRIDDLAERIDRLASEVQ